MQHNYARTRSLHAETVLYPHQAELQVRYIGGFTSILKLDYQATNTDHARRQCQADINRWGHQFAGVALLSIYPAGPVND